MFGVMVSGVCVCVCVCVCACVAKSCLLESRRKLPLDRSDGVGDDVIWGRALRVRAASGGAESAGEGREALPTCHLHHRCLHGYG